MSMEAVATRELEFSPKGETARSPLTIEVFKPFQLQPGQVSFNFAPGTSGCRVEFKGLGTSKFNSIFYGADLLQALQLATDIDPILRRINKEYELYFLDGESYFE